MQENPLYKKLLWMLSKQSGMQRQLWVFRLRKLDWTTEIEKENTIAGYREKIAKGRT